MGSVCQLWWPWLLEKKQFQSHSLRSGTCACGKWVLLVRMHLVTCEGTWYCWCTRVHSILCTWGDLLRKVPLPMGGAKKRNIILLTIWCILRWYIVTFDKTKQLWAYPISKTNLHHFLFMSVTLTFWVLRPFWALKSDLASVIALQLQHFVCQTFWYIKIRNPSTNKKVIPQNVKWYRFPKGLLC